MKKILLLSLIGFCLLCGNDALADVSRFTLPDGSRITVQHDGDGNISEVTSNTDGDITEDFNLRGGGSGSIAEQADLFSHYTQGARAKPFGVIANAVYNEMDELTDQVDTSAIAIGSAKQLVFYDPNNENNSLLDKVIRFIGITMGAFAVMALAVGAYFLIIDNGDQNQITKGKSILVYALIGVVITACAYFIIGLAVTFFTAT